MCSSEKPYLGNDVIIAFVRISVQTSYQNTYLLGTTSQNNDSRHDFIEYLRSSSTQKTIFFPEIHCKCKGKETYDYYNKHL